MKTKPTLTISRGMAFFIVLLMAGAPVLAQQKQATAIEEVAAAIEKALKSLTGAKQAKRPAPARPAMPAAPAFGGGFMAAPAGAPLEKDAAKRLQRLQSHAAVLQDWIDLQVELSEEQKQQLTNTLKSKMFDLQMSWKTNAAQNNQRALDDFFPICFTDLTGPALYLDGAGMEAVTKNESVAEDKAGKLLQALDKREAFYQAAARGYVLNLMDDFYFFTSVQREKIGEIVAKKVDLNAACFSMQTARAGSRYVQYFTSTSVAGTIVLGNQDRILTVNQKRLAVGSNHSNYVPISTGDDAESLQQQLKDSANTQRKLLNQHLAARIDFYQSTGELSDREVRRLQLASKGAMDDVMKAWKANTTKSIEGYKTREAFAGRNVRISMAVPDITKLLDNPLWTQTVETVVPKSSQVLFKRRKTMKEARAKFIVAMLDRELWLDSFQRERLLKSVRKIMPPTDEPNNHQRNIDEISSLCLPLFKLSKLDLTILSPAQRTVWKDMKEPFTLASGYVRIQTRRHGTLSIRIPK